MGKNWTFVIYPDECYFYRSAVKDSLLRSIQNSMWNGVWVIFIEIKVIWIPGEKNIYLSFFSFLLSYIFLSTLLFSFSLFIYPFPMIPIYSGDLVLFTFLRRSMYVFLKFLFVSSFSGVVDSRLVLFCFMSKSHF